MHCDCAAAHPTLSGGRPSAGRYPYLNIEDSNQMGSSNQFQFEFALDFIKQMPLINWMQVFPSDDVRMDHIHGYCVSKASRRALELPQSSGNTTG